MDDEQESKARLKRRLKHRLVRCIWITVAASVVGLVIYGILSLLNFLPQLFQDPNKAP